MYRRDYKDSGVIATVLVSIGTKGLGVLDITIWGSFDRSETDAA